MNETVTKFFNSSWKGILLFFLFTGVNSEQPNKIQIKHTKHGIGTKTSIYHNNKNKTHLPPQEDNTLHEDALCMCW